MRESSNGSIRVEVIHARPERQWLIPLDVAHGCTVGEAIKLSGIQALVPDIDIAERRVGIFYRPCALDTTLRSGDRVEIYRPLLNDPKDARRKRAAGEV